MTSAPRLVRQPIELPSYLDDPRVVEGRTYGRLFRSGEHWIVEGEPQVVQLAKRLFPGSDGRQPGRVWFPATVRRLGDLNWLMQRYPLEVVDEEAWSVELDRAREYVRHSMAFDAGDLRDVRPPAGEFDGELIDPFQREGLAWLLHHRRTLLADEMGLGKTVQALAFLATAQDALPALVVVQPHLMRQWQRAIERFLPGVKAKALRGLRPTPISKGMFPQIYVIHYGLLRGWARALEGRFPTVIFDEIQELRHPGTQKYSAADRIAGGAENVIGLSGTPIHNAGGEIWHVLNVIEMHCLGDFGSFTREWGDGYGSTVVAEPERLGAHLRETGLMLRRRKVDVLTQLPPKRRVIEEVDADEGVFGQLVAPAVMALTRFERAKTPFERGRVVEEMIRAARQATGVAKAPHVADFVAALLEAGEPVIVFAYHHAVVDILTSRLAQWMPGVITGRESKLEKDRSAVRFQSGDTRLCIVSLRAASGLDLFKARCVVFAELDWSPAVHSQAEDRAHRIGQEHDSVLAYYLVWNGSASTDPDVLDKLGFKASQFVGLMGDVAETEEDRALATKAAKEHVDRIVERIRQVRDQRRRSARRGSR